MSMENADQNLIKRLYSVSLPWIQIIGLIVVAVWWVATYQGKIEAQAHAIDVQQQAIDRHTTAIIELKKDDYESKQNYAVINQKLDDILNYVMTQPQPKHHSY
jgi:hypothetical protein